jgi:hypothetical protein
MPPDSDEPGNEPNLELPSFGFGRKKKRAKGPKEAATEGTATAPNQALEDDPTLLAAPTDAGLSGARAADTPADAPTAATTPAAAPAAPPAPGGAGGATPARTSARPPARPAARPASRPATPATPAAGTAIPPAAPIFDPADVSPSAAGAASGGEAEPPPDQRSEPPTVQAEEEPSTPRPSRRTRRDETRARRRAEKADRDRPAPGKALVAVLPSIKPLYAAIISGALSGIAAVLLALGASRGCEAVRDTSSCGGAGGLLALIVILALEVLVGATLLKAWQIADPYSTSFLGVGVVATLAMLIFLDQLDSPWMLLVIPLMTAAAFVLSWWVTVSFIDEHPMSSEVDAEHGEPAFRDQDSNA